MSRFIYSLCSFVITLLIIGVIFTIETKAPTFYVETPRVREHYIGKVKLNDKLVIRLLVLKHCREGVANEEGQAMIDIANLAASQGLRIQDIGNYHIDTAGQVGLVYTRVTIDGLKKFVSKQMKVDAEEGDTLIIYTTGHGSSEGSVQILGSRIVLGKAFAEAAEENNQETLWWQSSCYAAAGLPKIGEMNKKQQEIFSMLASSDANHPSYWGDQNPILKQLLSALASGSKKIDPNQDEIIVAKELASFLDGLGNRGRLLYAKSPDEPIFGWADWANLIPIVGPEGPEDHGDRYIPYPRDAVPTKTKGVL